jgi:hypothetical protein
MNNAPGPPAANASSASARQLTSALFLKGLWMGGWRGGGSSLLTRSRAALLPSLCRSCAQKNGGGGVGVGGSVHSKEAVG